MSVHHYSKEATEALKAASTDGELACALAFKIGAEHNTSPEDIGKILDLEEIDIAKCQLGLFGYKPDKKIVQPAMSVPEGLQKEITTGIEDGRLSCEKAWAIAGRLRISKMDVAAACENMGIKIKPCQLGAF